MGGNTKCWGDWDDGGSGGWGSLGAVRFGGDFGVWEVESLGEFRKLVMEGFGVVGNFWGDFLRRLWDFWKGVWEGLGSCGRVGGFL